jgi:hypothetical protein
MKAVTLLLSLCWLCPGVVFAQQAFSRMPEAQQRLYTPRPLPADFRSSALATLPAGQVARLSPGWLDKLRRTNQGPLLVYVAVFDCRYGLQELIRLDSLARQHPALNLMLVSADDWSLLGGIQDLYRTHHLARPVFTLDMLAYDPGYRPDKRLRQFAAEVPGPAAVPARSVKFVLLQDDQIVYTGPNTATLASLPGLLP